MTLTAADRRLLKRARILSATLFTVARAAQRIADEIEAADIDGRPLDADLIQRRVSRIEQRLTQEARALGVRPET